VGDRGAPPLVDGLFRVDPDGVTLLGGRSRSSGLSHFPRQPVCPYTGADDVEPVDLPRVGTLWQVTEVTASPPGYAGPVPYGLGIVVLEGGLRVVGRVLGDPPGAIPVGTAMEVVADVVPDGDGEPATIWAFAPGGPRP
jgi:uncharacterized OB-fold protein